MLQKIKYEIYPEFVKTAMQFTSIGTYKLFFFLLDKSSSDSEQKSWWSTRKMCEELEISRNTLYSAIEELEFFGIIQKHKTKKEGGQYANNTYYLNQRFCRKWVSGEESVEIKEGGSNIAPGVVQKMNQGGSKRDTLSKDLNRSKNLNISNNTSLSKSEATYLFLSYKLDVKEYREYHKDMKTNAYLKTEDDLLFTRKMFFEILYHSNELEPTFTDFNRVNRWVKILGEDGVLDHLMEFGGDDLVYGFENACNSR